ncbi:MAG: hypothetical protein AAGF50_13845, partial [Pseudomonadota bacterium]
MRHPELLGEGASCLRRLVGHQKDKFILFKRTHGASGLFLKGGTERARRIMDLNDRWNPLANPAQIGL